MVVVVVVVSVCFLLFACGWRTCAFGGGRLGLLLLTIGHAHCLNDLMSDPLWGCMYLVGLFIFFLCSEVRSKYARWML